MMWKAIRPAPQVATREVRRPRGRGGSDSGDGDSWPPAAGSVLLLLSGRTDGGRLALLERVATVPGVAAGGCVSLDVDAASHCKGSHGDGGRGGGARGEGG